MKLYGIASITILLLFLVQSYFSGQEEMIVSPETSVEELLIKLGEKRMPHHFNLIHGASVKAGEELVKYGITKGKNGRKVKKQSKHFVCTSCHNLEREDPDLRVSDPQARLAYVYKNGLPFLQGTTLYGAVNRSSFYNGDYEKKYGELTKKARHNLREAIQLCAIECSQGRRLKNWEIESILAYLWTIDLKLSDLNLPEEMLTNIASAIKNKEKNKQLAGAIKARFLSGSPATFVKPPEDRKVGYGLSGNPQNGELIYKLSCLHCHEDQRYSFFELDDSFSSKEHLSNHFHKYSNYSVYQVGRYGTPPKPGKRAYMPLYPEEKMSAQQMEDLRAYLSGGS